MTEAAVGLVDRLNRIDDRLGLGPVASVDRRLDEWPGARERWDARAEPERDSLIHAVLHGGQPRDREDVPLWFAALDGGETSSAQSIMGAFSGILATVFAVVVFGLDTGLAAMFIGVSAVMGLGQAFKLRRLRDRRRDLVVAMLPAADRTHEHHQ